MMTREQLEHELKAAKQAETFHWNEYLAYQREVRGLEGELQKLDKECKHGKD